MSEQVPSNSLCPFCGGTVDPKGWMGTDSRGNRIQGPECEGCGATAPSLEVWNKRHAHEPLQESGRGADNASRDFSAPTPRGSLPNSLGNEHLYQPDQEWMNAPLGAAPPPSDALCVDPAFEGTFCPFTKRAYFMHLDHPELGRVPTYGGPFDSYTVPVPDEDRNLRYERYDHDVGAWVEGGEPTGLLVISERELSRLSETKGEG